MFTSSEVVVHTLLAFIAYVTYKHAPLFKGAVVSHFHCDVLSAFTVLTYRLLQSLSDHLYLTETHSHGSGLSQYCIASIQEAQGLAAQLITYGSFFFGPV